MTRHQRRKAQRAAQRAGEQRIVDILLAEHEARQERGRIAGEMLDRMILRGEVFSDTEVDMTGGPFTMATLGVGR